MKQEINPAEIPAPIGYDEFERKRSEDCSSSACDPTIIYRKRYSVPCYNVDVAFCVDGSASMNELLESGISRIQWVKQKMLGLLDDLLPIMKSRGQILGQYRARIILFRDYRSEGEDAMLLTNFFCLPQQQEAFARCVNSICASGGDDECKSGLEALSFAIRSDWDEEPRARKRHIIMVFTNSGTQDLGRGSDCSYYPKGVPKTMSQLDAWWEETDRIAKRLVLLAPDENGWSYISQNWDNTMHILNPAGDGLSERGMDEILQFFTNSL